MLSVLLLGLSSLLIPIVLKQMSMIGRPSMSSAFRPSSTRQEKVLDAQAAVLDSLATSFWDYEGYATICCCSRAMNAMGGPTGTNSRRRVLPGIQPGAGEDAGRDEHVVTAQPRDRHYESFLRLYEEEVYLFDSCLLELMKIEELTSTGAY